jgi:HEPN domain-containing protein
MPPDSVVPGTPEDWLRHAASDLALASQTPSPGVLYETLCYHAQQAAEKSLKAVLVSRDVEFPYTHDIARLVTVVQDAGIAWRKDLDDAVDLTEYAIQYRYPGALRELTKADLDKAVEIATRLFAWAQAAV